MSKIFLLPALALAASLLSCDPAMPVPVLMERFQYNQFPVSGYTGASDTEIWSSAPAVAHNNNGELAVGNISGNRYRTLIQFSIEGYLPANISVQKAFLCLNEGTFSVPDINLGIDVYRINQSWSPATATWNSVNGLSMTRVAGTTVHAGRGQATIELPADMVKSWLENTNSNFGIQLRGSNETAANQYSVFRDSEAASQWSPSLLVYYSIN